MRPLYIQRYLITGLLTFIPIWLTWAVFKFIFSLLSQVNLPWAKRSKCSTTSVWGI